ncbi:MAG TPA: rhomboid family intramembrane serine protease, partial [Caulobacteraceae bacterium]|nr:rhomboid family intramembrane serine protease [Caulobacteraceae bacterium]
FFAFYLVCGVVGGLGLVMMDSRATVVGASGAISGFVGAAIRMLDGEGRVGPLLKRNVVIFTLVWGVGNYVLGAFGLTPGAIGIPVAWQAHLFGYLGGLLLVGVFARLAGRSDAAFTH